jgi:hypothetical protein
MTISFFMRIQPLTAEDKKAQVLAQKKAFDDRFVSNLHHIEGLSALNMPFRKNEANDRYHPAKKGRRIPPKSLNES